jgi:hypothetical protein
MTAADRRRHCTRWDLGTTEGRVFFG